MKKIIIIGGGITGLSAAWKLSAKSYKVDVIESDKSIGGLAKTIKIENYSFDIGPHSFFTEDKEIFKTVMDLFKGEPSEIPFSKRIVKMMFKGKICRLSIICKKRSNSNGNSICYYVFFKFCKIIY